MKSIYLPTIACMTVLLAACASSLSSQIYLPDGSLGYKIRCSAHLPAECLDRAGSTCGDRGYRTLNSGRGYMVIQCNSPASSATNSAASTFVNLSDDAIAARLLGAWSCTMEIAESNASVQVQGVSTYSRDGKYTSAGTLSLQGDGADNALGVSSVSNGDWRVKNGRLITTIRNVHVRALTAESAEMADALQQDGPKPGDEEAARFTALTDSYAVAVPESIGGVKQYCRKKRD